jgi:hypothetical protein
VVVAAVVLPAGGGAVVVIHGQVELPNLRVKRSHLTDGCGFCSLTPQALAMRPSWVCICGFRVTYDLMLCLYSKPVNSHPCMLQCSREIVSFNCRHKATLEYKFIRSLRYWYTTSKETTKNTSHKQSPMPRIKNRRQGFSE